MRSNLARTIAVFLLLLPLAGCIATGPRAEFTAEPRYAYPPLVVTFDGSGSSSPNGAIVSYDWDFGDGSSGDGVSLTHTYPEKGVYAVTLTVTDETGKSGSRSKTVEALNRVPIADFQPSVYAAPTGQPVRFDASDSYDPDGEIVAYIWDFGDGEIGDGVLVEHVYTTAQGSGYRPVITLTVIDDDGGRSSRSRSILVVGCDSCG